LRGDHGPDAWFGEQSGSCGVLLDQLEQLRIEHGELSGQEPDPGRDGRQSEHGQPVLHGCF
jgi:hypothetical protein